MNINKLLELLTEGRDVKDINKKLKGKVDTHVLETMSSLMKKGKYDNIAMAIFKALQEWNDNEKDDQKREFLIKRPKLVYAAMKEAAKDDSNFDPDGELTFFRYDNDEPMKYWANYRSNRKWQKETNKKQKKVIFGLPQARVKELPESYLFFPRNFKLDFLNFDYNINDLNRQYEDIKALSQQMADRDTSKGVVFGKKATDNHWCVASSNSNYYMGSTYKGGHPAGLFIIIVGKKSDGSPDWNDRFLLWIRPDKKWEFADKYDDHYDYREELPESTVKFINDKIIARLGGAKGEKYRQVLKDRAKEAYENKSLETVKGGWRKKVNVNSPIFKNYIKILRFLRTKYQERHGDVKAQGILSSMREAFIKALKWGETAKDFEETIIPAGEYSFKFKIRSNAEDRDGNPVNIYIVTIYRKGNDKDHVSQYIFSSDEIKQIIANPEALKKIKKWSYQELLGLDSSFKSKAYILTDPTPDKKVRDALRNNKLALQYYEDIATENEPTVANDEIHEFFIGPRFLITVMQGDNRISVLKKPWSYDEGDAQLIGDLRDKDIVEKVKREYEKLVAEGPEKA